MRAKNKRNLIGKMSDVSGDKFGDSIYLRPIQKDAEKIAELVNATGEKKSAIAQKLISLALSGKQLEFISEEKKFEKLDWLIKNEKHKAALRDVYVARLERLEEHSKAMENRVNEIAENARSMRILVSEIFCIANICMSFLNQIFTRLIEYFSPIEIEKKNSTDFANRNAMGLLQHSISELEKLSEYHKFEHDDPLPETLYLYSKIETLGNRISSNAESENR